MSGTQVIEIDASDYQSIIQNTTNSVVIVTPEPNLVDITLTTFNNTVIATNIENSLLNIFQGDLYFASGIDDILAGLQPNQKTVFTISENNTTVFTVGSNARTILHLMINQIDYEEYCAISPPGSGRVVYTPGSGMYRTEIGDRVVVHWSS